MRLLLVFLQEPIPGQVAHSLSEEYGEPLAADYYRAMVEVLVRQLQGLKQTRIRFCYAPEDAGDAIRFWLLPQVQARPGKESDSFDIPSFPGDQQYLQTIDFHPQGQGPRATRLQRAFKLGHEQGYKQIAAIGSNCPGCGARWLNAAFARLQSGKRDLILGANQYNDCYLLALHSKHLFTLPAESSDFSAPEMLDAAKAARLNTESLPPLEDVRSPRDWQQLLKSPLAAAIKKALGEVLESDPLLNQSSSPSPAPPSDDKLDT